MLTYPLHEQTLMIEIQSMIEKETRIPVEEQDILLASGASPDPNKLAAQCWNSPVRYSVCLKLSWEKHGSTCFPFFFWCRNW